MALPGPGVDPAGIEPASPGFRPSANPSQLGIHGRGCGIRTRDILLPRQAGWPNSPTPPWRCTESNRVGNACDARPLPQLLIPAARPGWRPAGTYGAHAVEMSCCRHVHPAGWCSARVEGIEPSLPALETGGVTVRYTRLYLLAQTKNRPPGPFPESGFRLLSLLSGSLRAQDHPRLERPRGVRALSPGAV